MAPEERNPQLTPGLHTYCIRVRACLSVHPHMHKFEPPPTKRLRSSGIACFCFYGFEASPGCLHSCGTVYFLSMEQGFESLHISPSCLLPLSPSLPSPSLLLLLLPLSPPYFLIVASKGCEAVSHRDFALGLPSSAFKFDFSCHNDCSPHLCRKELKSLEQSGSLKGSLSAEQQSALISGCVNLAEAVEGAMHIQVSQSQGSQV